MYVKPFERDLMDIEAYKLHKQLYVYLSPIIVVVGVIGNSLSFIVLIQRPTRRVSTYCYLIVLAIADTVVLTAGLLPKWIEQVFNASLPSPNPTFTISQYITFHFLIGSNYTCPVTSVCFVLKVAKLFATDCSRLRFNKISFVLDI